MENEWKRIEKKVSTRNETFILVNRRRNGKTGEERKEDTKHQENNLINV